MLMLVPLSILLCVRLAFSAFTIPQADSIGNVEQNAQGTWCWYPKKQSVQALTCPRDSTYVESFKFNAVVTAHLNTNVSIGYYDVSNIRIGGTEWVVDMGQRITLVLCLTGMSPDDGVYYTTCGAVSNDNQLPYILERCTVARGQAVVTDGCYTAGIPPPALPRPTTAGPPSRSNPTSSPSLHQCLLISLTRNTTGTSTTFSPSMPVGAIVGGVVGGLATLAIIVALLLFYRRRGLTKDHGADIQPAYSLTTAHPSLLGDGNFTSETPGDFHATNQVQAPATSAGTQQHLHPYSPGQ